MKVIVLGDNYEVFLFCVVPNGRIRHMGEEMT
jgi:hypothetical protein